MSNQEIAPHSALVKALNENKSAADWVGIRYSREVTGQHAVRNDKPLSNSTVVDEGVMVEVMIDGHIGYAATADLSEAGLKRAFKSAITATRAASPHKVFPFTLAQRPQAVGQYRSPRQKPLDKLSILEVTECLLAGSKAMAVSDEVVNRSAMAMLIQTEIHLLSSTGADIRQSFDMVDIGLSATAVRGTETQTRSFNRTGQFGGEIFQRALFEKEGGRVAREALELLAAENCPEGRMDLILTPDQMMLQIHESIGHPLELDRILGDERNYAGWSFVKKEDFGQLRYGSKHMNVTFDPAKSQEFASYAFDDGGNRATKEYLIKEGVLERGLGSLESQARSGVKGVANFRSASWSRAPIDRMANINLEPGTASVDEMVSQVERGVLMTTNRSWSIDDYRNKFQFGCERAHLIENGKITKLLKNPNYRGTTVDFWNRLAAVGRADLVETHGTPYCGKGEPNQIIRVGHAAPPCLFREVEVFGGQA